MENTDNQTIVRCIHKHLNQTSMQEVIGFAVMYMEELVKNNEGFREFLVNKYSNLLDQDNDERKETSESE